MKMDICVPKALPIVRAENLSWMAGVTFKTSSFRCGRELRHRKRPRDGDECNLFSRIRKWVGDDLVCSTSSSQLSPSCQVQLSPKDSGVDLNSPPHRDDGILSSSSIMPDSRSEECERTTVPLPKRRRSSSSDNLLKKERIDLVKMTRDFSKESKPPGVKSSKQVERTLETVSETITKKYTLVSTNTKAGPLVIKLRACPVESTQTTTVDEFEDSGPQLHSVESPGMISSTVHNQLTPVGSHDPVSSKKTSSRNRSNQSSVHQSKSLSTVVSSTTRHRKELKKKKKMPLPNPRDCVSMMAGALAGDSIDKSNAAAIDLSACLNVKHSKKADDSFAGKAKAFSDCDHKEAHTRAISPSARKVEVNSKKYARTRSNRESCVDEVSTCANSREVIVSTDSSLPVVSSSCAVAEREEFISEKLPLGESPSLTSNADDPSKDKKTNGFLSEFAKFIKSSDQSTAHASVPPLRHGPGSYQVTRRHARIFRRSTLVPQLHRSLLLRKELNRVQDLHSSLGVSVKEEPVHQVDLIGSNVALPQSCNALMKKNDDISVDTLGQLDSKMIGVDVLSSISSPVLLFDDEDDSEDNLDLLSTGVLYDAQTKSAIAPDLLSATSLCEARVGCEEIIPDDLLFDLPSTSSLCEAKDASELSVLEEALCHLPSTGSLSCESSFISDQMQLTKLRHSVFWLLKTLVPQLQLPNRFDMSGPAVDEMVDVVCEELDSRSRQQSTTRSELVSSELEDGCLNSLVGLCRSPHDCLARLRCKVLAMLSMLLGLDLDESNDEDLLESLLDAVVCANREDDEVLPNDSINSSPSMGTPELFRMDESDNERTFMPWEGEAPEEASSVDSFSDIPELLVEPERKFVTSDLEDFLEPPKLTAVDER